MEIYAFAVCVYMYHILRVHMYWKWDKYIQFNKPSIHTWMHTYTIVRAVFGIPIIVWSACCHIRQWNSRLESDGIPTHEGLEFQIAFSHMYTLGCRLASLFGIPIIVWSACCHIRLRNLRSESDQIPTHEGLEFQIAFSHMSSMPDMEFCIILYQKPHLFVRNSTPILVQCCPVAWQNIQVPITGIPTWTLYIALVIHVS